MWWHRTFILWATVTCLRRLKRLSTNFNSCKSHVVLLNTVYGYVFCIHVCNMHLIYNLGRWPFLYKIFLQNKLYMYILFFYVYHFTARVPVENVHEIPSLNLTKNESFTWFYKKKTNWALVSSCRLVFRITIKCQMLVYIAVVECKTHFFRSHLWQNVIFVVSSSSQPN